MKTNNSEAAGVNRLAADVHRLLETLVEFHVDAFLAEWPKTIAPSRTALASTLPALQWLPGLQASAANPHARLIAGLYGLKQKLAWSQTYRAEDYGAKFLDRYGWTELIGARGPIASETLAVGFLLLGPDVEYPSHRHTAEEIYVVLSGTAAWRRGGQPWAVQPPGAVVHHPSNMPHAMRTNLEPLLAMYLWRGGNLTQKSIIG